MVKMLFMDVDGTLTDGRINISSSGELFKSFDIKDGYAIKYFLPQYGIVPVILTARDSKITEIRSRELDIKYVLQGSFEKKKRMLDLVEKLTGITVNASGCLPDVAYIGDDLPDLECLKIVEYSACPADATKEIKDNVKFISSKNGGQGAVREFIEWLVQNS